MSEIEPHEELDDLLNGDEKPDLNAKAEKEEPEIKAEMGDDAESDKDLPEGKPEGDDEPATAEKEEVPPTSKEEEGQLQALKHERAKRQTLEMELHSLRQQLANQAKPQEPQQVLDPYSMEPEQFTKSLLEMTEGRISSEVSRIKAEMSEEAMIEKIGAEKYQEYFLEFAPMANQDPMLMAQLHKASNPAKFMVDTIEQTRLQREIGSDPAGYKQRLRDELKAELLAEMKGEMQAQRQAVESEAKRAALPRTIANAGTAAPALNELPDDSLAALLGE